MEIGPLDPEKGVQGTIQRGKYSGVGLDRRNMHK